MVCQKTKMQWEKGFPSLDNTWTHWWIEGDDELLAVIHGSKLLEALKIVEEYHEQYVYIVADRARLDFDGQLIPEKGRWVIASNQELRMKRMELSETFDPNQTG